MLLNSYIFFNKKKSERFEWFLTLKIYFECQIVALFDTSPLGVVYKLVRRQVFRFFDYLPTSVDIFYLMNGWQKAKNFDYLPNLSCKPSLWTTPYTNSLNSMISFDYSWFLAKNLSFFVSLPWKTPLPVLP